MAKEIEIPEGYEAKIVGNKVIIARESENEKIRKVLLEYFNKRNSYRDEDETFNGVSFPSIIAYLEKQKEQQPTEWSEEDDYMQEQAIRCINNSGKLEVSTDEIEDWLKSLHPQSLWKPSEEQIEALKCAVNDSIMQYDYSASQLKEEVTRTYSENLQSLLNDLNKL